MESSNPRRALQAVELLARRPQLAPGIAEAYGCTETVLWQRVMQVIDDPDMIAQLPAETARLRRLRDKRAAKRSGPVE